MTGAAEEELPQPRAQRPRRAEANAWFAEALGSDGEQVSSAGVARGMTKLGHGARLDLTNALAGQVEVLTDLFEGSGLATIEAESQFEDLALTLVERAEQFERRQDRRARAKEPVAVAGA